MRIEEKFGVTAEALGEIKTNILSMESWQLDEIITTIKAARSMISENIKEQLNVGDEVFFYHGTKGRLDGVVHKINRKKVVVKIGLVDLWNVPVSRLEIKKEVSMN